MRRQGARRPQRLIAQEEHEEAPERRTQHRGERGAESHGRQAFPEGARGGGHGQHGHEIVERARARARRGQQQLRQHAADEGARGREPREDREVGIRRQRSRGADRGQDERRDERSQPQAQQERHGQPGAHDPGRGAERGGGVAAPDEP
ncbi:hypothetical protein [Homoserinibacter gongjuensis]|uniref:Uncharacterized protein n=1 Tax=Homoserinibacter gongjuensis TaxID=1162968 RepID=A0ABQ6JSY0_9MICO|nr:hypothetical protein [Homoserinibacter gongjuensis]GMA89927.1 hypothetical protein GCM10025869_04560 [Homoserinibacter gongjuensis]